MTTSIRAAAVVTLLALSACWHEVADTCRSCRVVDLLNPRPFAVGPRGRALVVLVHGAFGFGDEWNPILQRARAHRELDVVAVAWRGPWRSPRRAARALLSLVQTALDRAPSSSVEVLVIAHSAGGLITDYMMRRIRIPPGRHVSAALVATPELRPIDDGPLEDAADTPLGLPLGRERAPVPALPYGVDAVEYRTEDAPTSAAAVAADAERPIRRVYMGAHAGHNAVLGVVGTRLLDALAVGRRPLFADMPGR